jgi:hypothetical protein
VKVMMEDTATRSSHPPTIRRGGLTRKGHPAQTSAKLMSTCSTRIRRKNPNALASPSQRWHAQASIFGEMKSLETYPGVLMIGFQLSLGYPHLPKLKQK